MDKHYIKLKTNYRQALKEKHIDPDKETNKIIVVIIISLTQI
jgi:hypothetical protein